MTTTYKETPRTDPENKCLADLALRGLHLLSDWTSVVTELYSWKLLHPTDHHMNNGCPPEAEEYERVSKNKRDKSSKVVKAYFVFSAIFSFLVVTMGI